MVRPAPAGVSARIQVTWAAGRIYISSVFDGVICNQCKKEKRATNYVSLISDAFDVVKSIGISKDNEKA